MPAPTPTQIEANFLKLFQEAKLVVEGTAHKVLTGAKLTRALSEVPQLIRKLRPESVEKLSDLLTHGYDVKDLARMLTNPNLEQAFTRLNALGYKHNGNALDLDELIHLVHTFKDAPHAKTTFKRLKAQNNNVVGFVHEFAWADHIGADDLSVVLRHPKDHQVDADVIKDAILYQCKFYEKTNLNSGNVGDWITAAYHHNGKTLTNIKIVVANPNLVDKNSLVVFLTTGNKFKPPMTEQEAESFVNAMLVKFP